MAAPAAIAIGPQATRALCDDLECFRKSGNRFSEKKHDKTKGKGAILIQSKSEAP
ncbi:MAG: hypothetical protein ABL907_20680 [Hyphomicrobium sp.]